MGAFLYLRIRQGEVSKAQEFQATLSYTASKTLPLKTTKNKKNKTKKEGKIQMFWSFAWRLGLANAEYHGRKYRTGICLSVEVRRQKGKEGLERWLGS